MLDDQLPSQVHDDIDKFETVQAQAFRQGVLMDQNKM